MQSEAPPSISPVFSHLLVTAASYFLLIPAPLFCMASRFFVTQPSNKAVCQNSTNQTGAQAALLTETLCRGGRSVCMSHEAGIQPRAQAPVLTGQSEQQIQMPSRCLVLPLLRSSRHFDHSSDLSPESPAECAKQGSRQTRTSAPAMETGGDAGPGQKSHCQWGSFVKAPCLWTAAGH